MPFAERVRLILANSKGCDFASFYVFFSISFQHEVLSRSLSLLPGSPSPKYRPTQLRLSHPSISSLSLSPLLSLIWRFVSAGESDCREEKSKIRDVKRWGGGAVLSCLQSSLSSPRQSPALATGVPPPSPPQRYALLSLSYLCMISEHT